MSETRIEARTPDGAAAGRLFLPEGLGPWPAVVFFMDAGGLRPAMSAMGERLASAGYAVIQPDLYWRSGPYAPFDMATMFADAAERNRVRALMAAVRPDAVVSDTVAFLDQVGDPRVRTDRIGVVGYCMGGRCAFVLATALPDRVAAVAPIHAGGLVSDAPDSPHKGAARIKAAVYVGVADQDGSCTPAHQETLRQALDAAGVRYTMELYRGARHGFAVADAPVYDPEAAERHWDRVLETLGTLRA
jgi:carboxymethylenebutenolidase